MPTSPPSMTAAPTSPDRADRATFAARAIALDNWRKTLHIPEITAALANIYSNAVDAYNNAVAAAVSAGTATTQAGLATAQAVIATASAATAANAPGTSATSATSLTLAVTSQTLTIQTGKSLVIGMPVIIAGTSAPSTAYMAGIITSYTSGTGVLVVSVSVIAGSGTYANWTVSLTGLHVKSAAITKENYFMGQL